MKATKRLYHFLEAKYALHNIECCRLKFSKLFDVNDPYELLPIICQNYEEENAFREQCNDVIKQTGIICFSETFRDTTLWGHYADKGKGIALGFDVQCDQGPTNRNAKKVKYIKQKLHPCEIGMQFTDGRMKPLDTVAKFTEASRSILMMNMFLTKSRNWRHEKEWRLLRGKKLYKYADNFFYYADKNYINLREILIGFRCKDENMKSKLEELIDNYPDPKPEIISTRLSLSTFDIEKVT